VRKCASDSLASLCAEAGTTGTGTTGNGTTGTTGRRLDPGTVRAVVLPAAAALAATPSIRRGMGSPAGKRGKAKKGAGGGGGADGGGGGLGATGAGGGGPPPGEADGPTPEDLRVAAAGLLADLAAPGTSVTPEDVAALVLPPLLALCADPHFRVRRAACQALPRLLAGGTVADAGGMVLPAFEVLSQDGMYRVRKAAGECLIDLSRALALLAHREGGGADQGDGGGGEEDGASQPSPFDRCLALRRDVLIPVCLRLVEDPNKFVRNGMKQFLGPLLASFYPLHAGGSGSVMSIVEGNAAERFGTGQMSALGARFFPHAAGMVGRLNPGSAAAEAAEAAAAATRTSLGDDGERDGADEEGEEDRLLRLLPPYLVAGRADQATLRALVEHRYAHPPHAEDLKAVREHLLPAFVALAEFSSEDENLDAEMRVYCAYSLPGVILLMGREAWSGDEDGLLRRCFLHLITGIRIQKKAAEGSAPAAASELTPVPLPVKRCLASSYHTISCILGRDIISAPGEGPIRPGMLQLFEHYFLRDPDDTVRLNVMRTLPSLLSLLEPAGRSKFLPTLHSIIVGDSVLGALGRRSATNPQLLNWRQRDAVSQILPDLVLLFNPIEVRTHLWPVLKLLLGDKVSAVRDDVEWCIPPILRKYALENVKGCGIKDARKWSQEATDEVVAHLKWSLLENEGKSPNANGAFSRRQMFCRTCAALAVALRLGKASRDSTQLLRLSPTDESGLGGAGAGAAVSPHPYDSYTSSEYTHMHSLLVDRFLDDALNMREDRVSNVRLTLVAALKVMSDDILDSGDARNILTTVDEEMRTWDSGFGEEMFYGEAEASAGPKKATKATSSTSTAPDPPSTKGKGGQGIEKADKTSKQNTPPRTGPDQPKSVVPQKDSEEIAAVLELDDDEETDEAEEADDNNSAHSLSSI
jgi:serine/threonine-protein phosphatase 4 regulatory subunit 1